MQYLIPPWKHQLTAIERARLTDDFALFFEMGAGKTGAAINILREHFARETRIMRTLILGPVITVKNWQNEFKMHSRIKEQDVVALSGKGTQRIETFLQNATDPKTQTLTRGRIFITNYEAMEMEDLVKLILDWKPEILVADESQRLKATSSVRAKEVIKIADLCVHRYIMTGTPILNSAMDIFNQYRILDGGKTFGKNFFEFRGRYFEDENRGMPSKIHFPKWVPRPETYEELNRKIYRKAMRVLKSECMDLPPLIKERVYVQLGDDQRRLYNEMKREYITWIKEHENSPEPKAVVAQMAITKALRLQQIASGFAKTEDGIEVKIKNNPRLKALEELLSDLTDDHKVIVWASFHENYRQIAEVCKKLKLKFVELHGGININDKNKNMQAFDKDPSVRVCVANAQAAGIGVNLVAASYSVFFSRNFSLEQDLQAESRNYRGGSEIHSKITRIDLVAEDTIDTIILDALAGKADIAEKVLGWTNEQI